MVLQKAKAFTNKHISNYNISKIMKLLKEIVEYEISVAYDMYHLADIERRVKELQMQFNEIIAKISQETHEMIALQLGQKTKLA